MEHVRRSIQIWRSILREPNLRRLELAFIGFNIAEYGTWIAMLVFTYRVGGVTASGLVGAVQLVPAALFAPMASVLGDHYRRDRVLMLGYLAQVITVTVAGVALISRPPLIVVYVLAALAATSVTLTRPVQGALLPSVAGTVGQLTAANVVSGWIEGAGIFMGPLLTGALLAAISPGSVFLVMASVLLVSTLLTVRLDVSPTLDSRRDASNLHAELVDGLRLVVGEPRARVVVSFLAANFFLVGSMDVLFVVLAFQLLHIGAPGVGFMNAAFGLGGLASVALLSGVVSRRRISPALLLGTAGWGIGLGLIAVVTDSVAAPLLIGIAGAGRPLVDITGRVLLQRVVHGHALARAFGILEGISMASQGAGLALMPLLISRAGGRLTFVIMGALLPALLIVLWRPLNRAGAAAVVPAHVSRVISGVPFFAPLSHLIREHLVMSVVQVGAVAGEVVIREGEQGDRFYMIEDGQASVSLAGREMAMLGPDDFFGEIALLREIPRTATVAAVTDLQLYALERDDFLAAFTGQKESRQVAEAVADARLQEHEESPVP